MKTIIILVMVAAVPVGFTVESAGGNHRIAIDRQWKQVLAWQEQQNRKFKAIEREAERSIGRMDDPKALGLWCLSIVTNGNAHSPLISRFDR